MSTVSSSTADTNARYQRLSAEYIKLRNQVSVLKTALLEEQKKGAEQQKEIVAKESKLRKLTSENESLEFRNSALIKRVESLQGTLDEKNSLTVGKGKKRHKEANIRLFGETSRTATHGTVDSLVASLTEELERKLAENCELHSNIFDMERQHEIAIDKLVRRISELEQHREVNNSLCTRNGPMKNINQSSTSEIGNKSVNRGQDGGEEDALFYISGLVASSKSLIDGLSNFLSLLEQRSLIYPFDTSMEPLPESTRKYCEVLVFFSNDLRSVSDAVENLVPTLPIDHLKIRRECIAIRESVNSTFQRMKTDLLPQLVQSLRVEGRQQWCSAHLESLNKEWERKLYITIDSLISATSSALFDADKIPTTISTLHQVFRELETSLRDKNFSENHLPTAAKKLKCVNACVEKCVGQLASTLGKIHSMVTDRHAIATLHELFQDNSQERCTELATKISNEESATMDLLDNSDRRQNTAEKRDTPKRIEFADKYVQFAPNKCDETSQTQSEDIADSENSMCDYYSNRLRDLSVSHHYTAGRAEYYKQECEALVRKALNDAVEKSGLEKKLRETEDKCASLQDTLETTQENYEAQIRGLYEHLAEQNDRISLLTNPTLGTQDSRNRQQGNRRENGLSGRR